jgi:two-component system NtrC family sensor kinase
MKTKQGIDTDYYKILKRNMMLTIIIVSLTPLILVGGVSLSQFRTSYQEKIQDHLKELVAKHKQHIDTFLEDKLSDIRYLAKSRSFAQFSDPSFLETFLSRLQENYGPVFEDLGVVNDEGELIAYAGPFKLGKAQYSEAEWFHKSISNPYFISDVFLGIRGLPHFVIAVRNQAQKTSWILRATIDFVAFNNLVRNIRVGKTGFAFIVNQQGALQTKQNIDFMPDKTAYMELLKNGKDADGVEITKRIDDNGTENIYASAFLKNGEWLLVYQQHASDAFKDIRHAQRIAILIFVIGGLGIVTTAYIISNKMIHQIANADREKELLNQQVIETGKLASIGQLAAGIAHEINNPVAIMVEEAGWITDLLEEEEFRESENLNEFHRALKQIRTQGQRCKEITHKLLSFARKTDARTRNIEINELLEDVISLSAQRARYANVEIKTHFQDNLPLVSLSQSEMQQVILNLINNALDAMDKRGGTLNITSHLEKDHIVIAVEDNGPGISKENLARIFDPFFTTKPVGKGTGLGLSICYGIIQHMGGKIEVRSAPEAGTKFTISLPASVSAPEKPEKTTKQIKT